MKSKRTGNCRWREGRTRVISGKLYRVLLPVRGMGVRTTSKAPLGRYFEVCGGLKRDRYKVARHGSDLRPSRVEKTTEDLSHVSSATRISYKKHCGEEI